MHIFVVLYKSDTVTTAQLCRTVWIVGCRTNAVKWSWMFGVQTPLNAGCTDCNVSLPHFMLPFGICSVQSQLNVTFVLTSPATAS